MPVQTHFSIQHKKFINPVRGLQVFLAFLKIAEAAMAGHIVGMYSLDFMEKQSFFWRPGGHSGRAQLQAHRAGGAGGSTAGSRNKG